MTNTQNPTTTAPCDICQKPVTVPDDWPLDYAYHLACRKAAR